MMNQVALGIKIIQWNIKDVFTNPESVSFFCLNMNEIFYYLLRDILDQMVIFMVGTYRVDRNSIYLSFANFIF